MSLRLAVAALTLGACGFSVAGGTQGPGSDAQVSDDAQPDAPDPDAPAGAWLDGFAYRRAITVTAGGTETLVNFPVAIMRADVSLKDHARSDGTSFVVTSDDALTRLDSEVASYDATTGALELWVRVPSLPPTATTLYLYYDPAITASTNPTGVWSSLFMGVWHFSDSGDGAHDSTLHGNDLSLPTMIVSPLHIAGIAGPARAYGGLNYLQVDDPPDGSLDVDARSFSYSVWVNEVAPLAQFDCVLHKGGPTQSQPGYTMLLGSGTWHGKIHDGTSSTSYLDATFGNEPAFQGQWTHLVSVVDRTASKFRGFANGTMASEVAMALGSLATTQPLRIGSNASQGFDGSIDEVRIYDGALTPGWIAAEHANLTALDFVQVGPETPR